MHLDVKICIAIAMRICYNMFEVSGMPDYKDMYLKMFKASEQVINILTAVQRECEEHYISSPEQEFQVIELLSEAKKEDVSL